MIKREMYLDQIRKITGTDFIKVIIGLRRCGKTSLLKSIMEDLQNQGINKKNIIYISFELVEYKNNRNKVEIICPVHGSFYQYPHDHLNGCGCPKCKGRKAK